MEHFNPLLKTVKSPQKFITIGEIMLRLTPPNYEKIRTANEFEANYGGSEANIALALANLGIDSTFFRSTKALMMKWTPVSSMLLSMIQILIIRQRIIPMTPMMKMATV